MPCPEPARAEIERNAYVFEKTVIFTHPDGCETRRYIDLYKRGCFVLEAKQGVEAEEAREPLSEAAANRRQLRRKGHGRRGSRRWDDVMLRARGQAEAYVRALPGYEGRPPFIVVVDVGHAIELYSEFSQTGGTYVPFPDPRSHRIHLDELIRPEIRARLRAVWTDPLALDPSRHAARATRDIAEKLARLARSLEGDGHSPESVAGFLMRCLFTMFCEDSGAAALPVLYSNLPHRSTPRASYLARRASAADQRPFAGHKTPRDRAPPPHHRMKYATWSSGNHFRKFTGSSRLARRVWAKRRRHRLHLPTSKA